MTGRSRRLLLPISIVLAVVAAASIAEAAPSILSVSAFTDNRSNDDPLGSPGYQVSLQALVSDPAGVPGNILSVTARNLSTNETLAVSFSSVEANVFQGPYTRFIPFANSRLGVWRFTVTNKQGETTSLDSHNLDKPNQLALPASIALANFPGTATAPPRVSFDPVPNATGYAFEIYNANLLGLFVTPSSPTPSFQIPTGVLVAGQQFYLRARAFQEDLTEPVVTGISRVENRSVNTIQIDPGVFLTEKVATVSSVTGSVQVAFQGTTVAIRPGSLVVKGTEPTTGADGQLRGSCSDGSQFNLGPSSRAFLEDSLCSPVGSGLLDVTQGAVTLVSVNPPVSDREARAQGPAVGVQTPVGVSTPVGGAADFTTTYNEAGGRGTATTTVRSGTVAVTDAVTGAVNMVAAGQQNTTVEPVPTVVASILPNSRSVQVGRTATVFATILNAGKSRAIVCRPSLATNVPVTFSFQTTDPATNLISGTKSTPVNIPAGAGQSFVLAFTPTAPIPPTDLQLSFACGQTPAPVIVGVSTMLLSASATPIPDIVALTATLDNNGIVNISPSTGTGVFAVATVNLGVAGTLTASADTGSASLPVAISVCQTNPATGACLAPPSGSVTTTINAGATPTFGIFPTATGAAVPFDPATHRIFVRFKDPDGATRGSTSVAVRTQ